MSTKTRKSRYRPISVPPRRPYPSDIMIAAFYFRWSIQGYRLPPSARRRKRPALPRPAPGWQAPARWAVRATEPDGQPRTLAIDLAEWLTLQITRHHTYPGYWVMQAPPVVEQRLLASGQLEQAKAEAEVLLRGFLRGALARLADASPPTCPICLAPFGTPDPWLNGQHIQACHGYDPQVAREIARIAI